MFTFLKNDSCLFTWATCSFPVIYQDVKPDSEAAKSGQLYVEVAKSQLKKMTKLWQQEVRKSAEKAKKEAEAAEAQAKRAEEAKKITVEEDKTLPQAQRIRICQGEQHREQRVKVYGWVHRLRRQGKALMFITLRDGSGFLQCVLNGTMCQTYDAIMLSTEVKWPLFYRSFQNTSTQSVALPDNAAI